MEFGVARRDLDPIGVLAEQIDDGRAEEREARRIDEIGERPRRTVEQHDDLDFPAVDAREPFGKAVQREEPEPRGAGEVLVQQIVPVKLGPVQRQQALIGAQSFVFDRALGDGRRRAAGPAKFAGCADYRGDAACMQQFEQMRRDLFVARQIDRKSVESFQVGDPHVAGGREPDPQRPAHWRIGRAIALQRRDVRWNAGQPGVSDRERPQRDVLSAREPAGRALAVGNLRGERGAAREAVAIDEAAFGLSGVQASDRDRRGRRDVVRVDDLEQPFREARKLRIELDLHARGHEAERFDQALDIRVRHFAGLHAEPPCDLRMRMRELGGELAHVNEFLVVVVEQSRVHRRGLVVIVVCAALSRRACP
ncbi:hypothetical protein FEQ05_03445 [Burkholderia pseudomultivorans]|uniref:Uncharacterized protein n=1 Tax=Burkholderia pseudomultivorans TaxID=1207504 RepID=A0ABU2E7B1_9BURK|nr:hypothetical protein [Burkholderia pseudomultivorans]MDR8733048.1 hypothetical protein [Burkholderia pseudomultivorans]MDR8739915.1 hypothetical protein [Burkholderia pseudomultivorans]MDR8755750.1 hypothetical protein [Burkholderia pseudomultivorans]MDR8776021.1 hypothetical protein [Burkholderia pseudomultivorans]